MNDRNKRVLWLVNHKALIDFEPRILEELGYEVFVPKLFPNTSTFRSGGTTYSYDSHLTIPPEILELLNNTDFYNGRFTPKTRKIINSYFSVLIVHHLPVLQQAIENFEGHIVYRTYGTINESIEELLISTFGEGIREAIERLGPRFHFTVSFEGHAETEPEYLKRHALFLPYGMPDRFFSLKEDWNGNDPRLFFVCPVIADNEYYGTIYRQFKENFNEITHVIGGLQYHPVNDPTVLGKVDRDEFDKYLRTLKVMYYQSHEPRLVHLHVLEAMAFGMPVIFMKDNLLGRLDEKNGEQPGACQTIREAKTKIKRLLVGDKKLADEIRSSQKRLLQYFNYDYCLKEWQKNFVPSIKENILEPIPAPHRIAVILPAPYKGGTLDAAKAIAKMICLGSRQAGTPVEVIFAFLRDQYNIIEDFEDLKKLGIDLREFEWDVVERDSINAMVRLEGQLISLEYPKYAVPRDGMRDFLDTDRWIVVSDSIMYPLPPLRKYCVVVHDCLPRYFSEYQNEALDGRISVTRSADFVFTTTPMTREDVISFYGISPERVFLVPNEFGMDQHDLIPAHDVGIRDYFVWSTNPAPHKNQIRALNALLQYLLEGGRFQIVITGSEVDQFNIDLINDSEVTNSNVQECRKIIRANKILKDHLIIKGNLPKQEYYNIVRSAQFVWHPALCDNGTFCVVDGSALGVPSCSSDYPQMHYLDKIFKLNLMFFNPHSTKEIANALHIMEKESGIRKGLLPSNEDVFKMGWNQRANLYWKIYGDLI